MGTSQWIAPGMNFVCFKIELSTFSYSDFNVPFSLYCMFTPISALLLVLANKDTKSVVASLSDVPSQFDIQWLDFNHVTLLFYNLPTMYFIILIWQNLEK